MYQKITEKILPIVNFVFFFPLRSLLSGGGGGPGGGSPPPPVGHGPSHAGWHPGLDMNRTGYECRCCWDTVQRPPPSTNQHGPPVGGAPQPRSPMRHITGSEERPPGPATRGRDAVQIQDALVVRHHQFSSVRGAGSGGGGGRVPKGGKGGLVPVIGPGPFFRPSSANGAAGPCTRMREPPYLCTAHHGYILALHFEPQHQL